MAFKEILLLLLPLVIVQLGFQVYALLDLWRNEEQQDKLVWALVIIFLGFIGPLIYFLWSRKS
ncbi:MAG: PLD nuclease N-terminal domain-containing protein [Candidatus Baldrarchaeia archaeon]